MTEKGTLEVGDDDAAAVDAKIARLVQEYALNAPADRPLDPGLSLRDDIGLDSFSLVSLMLRLGEEFNVDFAEESARLGINLEQIATFGDLLRLGRSLSEAAR
jgi:acyl carrier protein